MPKSKQRDRTLPPGFGGQPSVASMWFPQAGFLPGGMPMANMMQMPNMMTGMHPMQSIAEAMGSDSGASANHRRNKMKSESENESRRSPSFSDDSVVGESVRKKKRRKCTSNGSDADIVSSNYRYLGGKHIYGEKTTWPKVQKIKVLRRCNEDEYNPLRLASMEDHTIDQLVFLAANCPPSLKIADLKIRTKGELRKLLQREYVRVSQHQPSRFKMLSPDYANLEEIVIALGYPKKFLIGADCEAFGGAPRANLPHIPVKIKEEHKEGDNQSSPGAGSASIKAMLLSQALASQSALAVGRCMNDKPLLIVGRRR